MMMTATEKRESELWGAADATAGDWFRRQCRDVLEPMFLWFKPGTVAFWIGADGLNEDWRKASPLQVSPAWTRDRVKFWIVDIARVNRLPIYSPGKPARETIADFNAMRKANKGSWFTFRGNSEDGRPIAIKAYGTWIQIAEIGESGAPGFVRDCGPMDVSVGAMNSFLRSFLSS